MAANPVVAAHDQALARSAIGLREVLFQSVTHMAPAGAVAFSIAIGAAYAGGSLPAGCCTASCRCSASWPSSPPCSPRWAWGARS